MPALSLCMIVRNEEGRLEHSLESVKDAADEMVVVDTGSTDRTVEIARAQGAKVVSFAWCDDFSAARNFALDQATGDWILHLDADEELEMNDIPLVRKFIEPPELDGVYVAIHNHERLPDGRRKTVIHPYPRLFRRRPDIRYQGLVHEFLTNLHHTVLSGIRIYHYGYDCPEQEQQAKRQRNETLCRRQLEHDPGNPVAHFSLAGIFLSDGRIDEAKARLEEALRLIQPKDPRYQHFYLMSLHYLAAICGTQGDLDRAVEYCHQAIALRADYLDPQFLLGELQFRQGKAREAEMTFKEFLARRDQLARRPARGLFSQSRLNSHDHVHLRLGQLFQGRGDLPRAEWHYQQALEANPQSVEANLQLSRFYTLKLDVAKAKHYLTAAQRLQQKATERN